MLGTSEKARLDHIIKARHGRPKSTKGKSTKSKGLVVMGKTEAKVEVPEVPEAPGAVSRAQEGPSAEPRTTANHALNSSVISA